MRIALVFLTAICGLILAPQGRGACEAATGGSEVPAKPPLLYLSLEEAIQLALANNYDLLLAQERVDEARGVASTRLGALVPNLSGTWSYNRLKAFLGQFGGAPTPSTPRDIWDLRARLTQPLYSMSLIQQWRAGRAGVDIAGLDAEVARRDTIATAALLYMESLRAEAAMKGRESNVKLNYELWEMTKGRKRAGAATGIDVLRAQGQLESERQRLLASRNEFVRAKLNLIQALAIRPDTPIALTGNLEMKDLDPQAENEAVLAALDNRSELKAQRQRRRFAELTLSSVTGERYPVLDIRGDYGLIGEEHDDRVATYTVGAFFSLPFFDGQREGRISESRSQLRQADLQTRNLILQISIEAQNAYETLQSTHDQVVVARQALELALEELRLSQKAFSIGTLSHIEVIGVQIRVANARDIAIEALFNFNAARVNMARAQGRMEQIFSETTVVRDDHWPGSSVAASLAVPAPQR